jgi:hypothetical protein
MTLALTLPAELEARLRSEAERCGQSADALAVQLLDRHLPADRRTAALDLLRAWAIEDDALSDQEAEENAAVLRSLDANRSSDRLLFPDLAEKPS